jgi:DNA-binding MarR family transcriptional regulator
MARPRTGDEIVDTLLYVCHRIRHNVNDTLVANVGLTLSRFKVLQLIADEGPSRLRDLADGTDVSARTMTETIDWLERAELVTRTVHPTDRRALLVVLTDAGRDRLNAALEHRSSAASAVTRRLSPSQRDELERLLLSVLEAIPDPRAGCGPVRTAGRTTDRVTDRVTGPVTDPTTDRTNDPTHG